MQTQTVGIIGSGVVGQATGRGLLKRGVTVTFVDTNIDRVQQLRQEGLDAITATDMPERGGEWDVMIITVPTPTEQGTINLDYLRAASREVAQSLRVSTRYPVVVVRSTVVPGTTEHVALPLLEEHSGKRAGRDFGLCMNPEFLREKSSVTDFDNPWVVVIGQLNARSGDVLARLYQSFDCPIFRVSLQEAELQKYVHNLFNAVKITFFNELRRISELTGADAEAIFPLVAKSCEGMWNPEYGTKNLGPFAGMCLPKDTSAFLSWARTQGWDMPLLATAIAVNQGLGQGEQVSAPEAVSAPAESLPFAEATVL